jgi:AraC family transcriptional regulator
MPSLETTLIKRFHLRGAPTVEARVAAAAPPIAFSRIRNDRPQQGRSLSPPQDDAFVFQLPLSPAVHPDLRYINKKSLFSGVQRPGQAFLLDMSAGPTVRLDTEFDNFRVFMSQRTIDELALEKGLRRVGGLLQRTAGAPDPVMFHLAKSLLPALENPGLVSTSFVEHLSFALHDHVITVYGGLPTVCRRRSSRLASWQMRRVRDLIEANLAGNPTIAQLARTCDLSASYFAEAFKQTTGISPHQWLVKRRIERAKAMLCDKNLSLASIATDCGFFDQSHFSRVFARLENHSPSQWRRLHRSDGDPKSGET